jgi:hypothetical protein
MQSFRDVVNLRKFDFPEIVVSEPVAKSSGPTKHVVYKVAGKDYLGEFEVMRRYSHFALFREVLCTRFPALYIPPMPPKKKLVSI